MKFFYFTLLLLIANFSPLKLEAKTTERSLPPKIEFKLLELNGKVAELEKKSFSLKQKIKEINLKIFKKKFRQIRDRVVIKYQNRLNSTFRLMEVKIFLVSNKLKRKLFYTKRKNIRSSILSSKIIFNDRLAPGIYSIQVVDARVQGYSPVFTYLNSYKMKIGNGIRFTVEAKRRMTIIVEFFDKGGMNIKKRLKIRFKISQR